MKNVMKKNPNIAIIIIFCHIGYTLSMIFSVFSLPDTHFSHSGQECQTFCLLSFSTVSSFREVILTGFVYFALYCLSASPLRIDLIGWSVCKHRLIANSNFEPSTCIVNWCIIKIFSYAYADLEEIIGSPFGIRYYSLISSLPSFLPAVLIYGLIGGTVSIEDLLFLCIDQIPVSDSFLMCWTNFSLNAKKHKMFCLFELPV